MAETSTVQTQSKPLRNSPGGLARGLVRPLLAAARRDARLIGGSGLPHSAAILRICHTGSLAKALLLDAAIERQVACVLDGARLGGGAALAASASGVILYQNAAAGWHRALRACTEALTAGALLAVFEEQDGGSDNPGRTAFALACEAWAAAYPDRFPVIVPVHMFWPAARSQEILIHVGGPMAPDADEDAPVAVSALQLDAAFRKTFGESVFALESAEFGRLLGRVEESLRDQLQSEWAAETRRRQSVEGFELSPLAAEKLHALNRGQPEALMDMLQLAEATREARRQWSLVTLRAEFEGRQLAPFQRVLGWAETALGFPVAFYGAVNHLVAGLVVIIAGLGPRRKPDTAAAWWARGLVVLGAYVLQVALVNHFFGRATAGYYAASLPASGLYLLRYAWLLRRRTRVLLLGMRANWLRTSAEKTERKFHERLEGILAATPLRRTESAVLD